MLKQFRRMAFDVSASWVALSNMWTTVWSVRSPTLFLNVPTPICQFRPLFPNQLDCDSLYCMGINFIAQSRSMRTSSASRVSKIRFLAMSWLTDRNRCFFHSSTARTPCIQWKRTNVNAILIPKPCLNSDTILRQKCICDNVYTKYTDAGYSCPWDGGGAIY
jgi:hypothetical protein